nr:MAG TPA: hypothetical protein [Caudoviricetes sp.]
MLRLLPWRPRTLNRVDCFAAHLVCAAFLYRGTGHRLLIRIHFCLEACWC